MRFERTVQLQPDFLPARRVLVELLLHLDHPAAALEHARAWQRLRPEDANLRAQVAQLQALVEQENRLR